ncbi:MAG: hypothetical protein ACKV2U_22050 [Bryobacteraceae bacterium]
MEIRHGCRSSIGEFAQTDLLSAAETAVVRLFPRPLGRVLKDNADLKPKPRSYGITANMPGEDYYDYWAISRSGDFFAISTFSEDQVAPGKLYFNIRIARAAEAIAHCASLYKALGADAHCIVELTIAYSGLSTRILSAPPGDMRWDFWDESATKEDEVSASVSFRLGYWESDLTALVKQLCAPLFVLFDFKIVEDGLYDRMVSDFLNGKV